MNSNYILFHSYNLKKLKPDVYSIINEKCKDNNDYETCYAKYKQTWEHTFKILDEQLIREKKLDTKYDRMHSFKRLRKDVDSFE